ncbi:MAG: hypothetical protein J6331_02770, partial [Lentisphaeria bacterium]|nr:hypothetical protein [Lentisphaeria bacterium]
MKKTFTVTTALLVFACLLSSSGAQFASKDAVIIRETKNASTALAAETLQKHLSLIAGGKLAPGEKPYKFILREEDLGAKGRWETLDDRTVFTGKDRYLRYAVLDFLEKQLGFVWMDHRNTVFRPREKIEIPNGKGEFADRFEEHFIWPGGGKDKIRPQWIRNVKADR